MQANFEISMRSCSQFTFLKLSLRNVNTFFAMQMTALMVVQSRAKEKLLIMKCARLAHVLAPQEPRRQGNDVKEAEVKWKK